MKNRNREADMLKLADAFFHNLQSDGCEWGGIGLDCKRPFGNSDMPGDVCEIIGLKMTDDNRDEAREYAISLYNELPNYLRKHWVYTKHHAELRASEDYQLQQQLCQTGALKAGMR